MKVTTKSEGSEAPGELEVDDKYPFMGFFESHKWVWACHGYRDKAFLTRTHSGSYERFKKSEKTEVKKKKK